MNNSWIANFQRGFSKKWIKAVWRHQMKKRKEERCPWSRRADNIHPSRIYWQDASIHGFVRGGTRHCTSHCFTHPRAESRAKLLITCRYFTDELQIFLDAFFCLESAFRICLHIPSQIPSLILNLSVSRNFWVKFKLCPRFGVALWNDLELIFGGNQQAVNPQIY